MAEETESLDPKFWGISKEKVWVPILITFYVVALWAIPSFTLNDDGGANRRTFGDMFGAINALFSGLAFAGIIYTILLQRKELELQHKELKATNKEFKEQNETLRTQKFENTFFSMLSQHNEMVRSFSHRLDAHEYEGRRVLSYVLERLEDKIKDQVDAAGDKWLIPPDLISIMHNELYAEFVQDLGVYYRSLYRILKYVDDAKIGDYKEYIEIVKSQLTDAELGLLFWHGITQNGFNFKALIEEYKILDALNIHNSPIAIFKGHYKSLASL